MAPIRSFAPVVPFQHTPQLESHILKSDKTYIITSFTAASSHITSAVQRLDGILRAHRVPYDVLDASTNPYALKVVRIWAYKRRKAEEKAKADGRPVRDVQLELEKADKAAAPADDGDAGDEQSKSRADEIAPPNVATRYLPLLYVRDQVIGTFNDVIELNEYSELKPVLWPNGAPKPAPLAVKAGTAASASASAPTMTSSAQTGTRPTGAVSASSLPSPANTPRNATESSAVAAGVAAAGVAAAKAQKAREERLKERERLKQLDSVDAGGSSVATTATTGTLATTSTTTSTLPSTLPLAEPPTESPTELLASDKPAPDSTILPPSKSVPKAEAENTSKLTTVTPIPAVVEPEPVTGTLSEASSNPKVAAPVSAPTDEPAKPTNTGPVGLTDVSSPAVERTKSDLSTGPSEPADVLSAGVDKLVVTDSINGTQDGS